MLTFSSNYAIKGEMRAPWKRSSLAQRLTAELAILLLALLPVLPTNAAPVAQPTGAMTHAPADSGQTIPMDQLGLAADKQAADTSSVVTTADGATIRAAFQDLAGWLRADGLWLHSTADDAFTPAPFRVMAQAWGREAGPTQMLPATGAVAVAEGYAQWRRPGVVEEYSATSDGVRQDFLLLQPPAGAGQLRLELAVAGAAATAGDHGLHLTLADSGRELVYGQLHVTDAVGRVLPAQMRARTPTHITILVDDYNATWPLRIDPTFSDADWVSMGTYPEIDGIVRALAVSGNDLYVGGSFLSAGGVNVNNIAKWNGSVWSALGTGVSSQVNALATSGSDLYVGGAFTNAGGVTGMSYLAKWNGSAWSALGAGISGQVNALVTSGNDLYVGGLFASAGGVAGTSRIAKWNGNAWSALGTGVNSTVNALATNGSDLYVGGLFTTAGGVPGMSNIAKWNGSAWSALGTGVSGQVNALATSGSDLYVGGLFTSAGGVAGMSNIAQWNGSTWSALSTGVSGQVNSLVVNGSDLYVGGAFTSAGSVAGTSRIAKWNGGAWSALGAGVDSTVFALATNGSDLYVGGIFASAGGVAGINYIAKWNGGAWSALGARVSGQVNALAVSGSDLYVGGAFTSAGGVAGTSRIAKWNGNAWSALSTGVNNGVYALAISGNYLYVGGALTIAGGVSVNRIAKWDGSMWSALGAGVSGQVNALAVSGSDLYVGGNFLSAGGMNVNNIAKWDGSAWSALGIGVSSSVLALATIGSDLYVGGAFTNVSSVTANRIAKWDGSAWSALGAGVNSTVRALATSGSVLYVGGDFTSAGGVSVDHIAQWNGGMWSALGDGVNNGVYALAVRGSDLYVGGNFLSAGSVTGTSRIAQWNGSAWSALGTGANNDVYVLATSGSDLYVGGLFTKVGGKGSSYLAKAQLPQPVPEIALLGNDNLITNGDTTPSSGDHTDFGSANANSATVVRTFIIQNSGDATLANIVATVNGSAAFSISSSPATTVSAGANTTFQITFAPSASGAMTATVNIASDDADENPYTFVVGGVGVTPQATLTVVLDTRPDAYIDLGFDGSFGTFYLDDLAVDDGDNYTNSHTFTVAPGAYMVRRFSSSNWYTTAIACTPSSGAIINLPLRRVNLTLVDGDAVTCIFTVDRSVTIHARAFNDLVRNSTNWGKRNAGDPWLANWTMSVFSAPGVLVTSGVTRLINKPNLFYEAVFSNLRPGSYVVCVTLPDETWSPTAPALDSAYGQPCTPVTLAPGQAGTLAFGVYQPIVAASEMFTPADEVITDEDRIVDVPIDPTEVELILDETAAQRLYLPLIQR